MTYKKNIKHVRGCAIQFALDNGFDLAHQVNMQGVMGGGIAKSIKKRFPKHYEDYKSICDKSTSMSDFYSPVQTIIDKDRLIFVFGVFAQKYYGTVKRQTNYAMLINGLGSCIYDCDCKNLVIPKFIGCGLGGGDWRIVEVLLEDLADAFPNTTLWICEL